MPKYVIAFSRKIWHRPEQMRQGWMELDRCNDNTLVIPKTSDSKGLVKRRIVVDANPKSVAALQKLLPPMAIVEPLIPHTPQSFNLRVESDQSAPIPGARIRLHITKSSTIHYGMTNAQGRVNILAKGKARIEASPIPGYWSMWRRDDAVELVDDVIKVLPLSPATDGLGWWHHAVGIKTRNITLGAGVRVGVIDTGCGPHPALAHAQAIGTFVDGTHTEGADDVGDHGTHVCGIITALPSEPTEFLGIAPKVALYTARVYQDAQTPCGQADIADALDRMTALNVHLVNLSLGARQPSQTLIDSIVEARLNGTVCVAAAGNLGGAVLWPAHFEQVIAVTALGRKGAAPPSTLSQSRLDGPTDDTTGLTFANFCCTGPQVDCCAPGIGIISTIPGTALSKAAWGDMDGTSMASPIVLGVLAGLLAADPEYLAMRQEENRSKRVFEVLEQQTLPISFLGDCQGRGLITRELGF